LEFFAIKAKAGFVVSDVEDLAGAEGVYHAVATSSTVVWM
jgi:hypothetical protein